MTEIPKGQKAIILRSFLFIKSCSFLFLQIYFLAQKIEFYEHFIKENRVLWAICKKNWVVWASLKHVFKSKCVVKRQENSNTFIWREASGKIFISLFFICVFYLIFVFVITAESDLEWEDFKWRLRQVKKIEVFIQ